MTIEQIAEAFEAKKYEKGQVKFSQSKFDDAHIKKIIADIAKKAGVPEADILNHVHAQMKKIDELAKVSPILYATIQQNIVENEVFKLVEEAKNKGYGLDTKVAFDLPTFYKLFRYIKVEHDQFFPLRNFVDHKFLHNPVIIIVPSPQKEYKKFNKIDTAAATPTGQFIFNKVFMQNLLDYAHVKGLKPKGKKYKSNGGEIPDEYAYIEFLIIHELMHYTYADFHYQKILKAKNKIINWVGDFRSNYLMVKSGMEQLPIGLFSDDVNYDRQKSYREMYEVVKAEFDKLDAHQKSLVEGMIGKIQGGEHGKTNKTQEEELKVGHMVTDPNGKIRIIEKIHPNGKVEVRELTAAEKQKVEDAFKKTGALGVPQDVKDGLK